MWDNNAFDTNKLHFLEYGIQHGKIDVPEFFVLGAIIRYDIESSLILNSNINDKLIKAEFTINIITDKNENNQKLAKASFHIYYIFKVDNFEELTIILENGKISQQGTHASLSEQDGLYRRIVTIQSQMIEGGEEDE